MHTRTRQALMPQAQKQILRHTIAGVKVSTQASTL